jgi:hypothetical protein
LGRRKTNAVTQKTKEWLERAHRKVVTMEFVGNARLTPGKKIAALQQFLKNKTVDPFPSTHTQRKAMRSNSMQRENADRWDARIHLLKAGLHHSVFIPELNFVYNSAITNPPFALGGRLTSPKIKSFWQQLNKGRTGG